MTPFEDDEDGDDAGGLGSTDDLFGGTGKVTVLCAAARIGDCSPAGHVSCPKWYLRYFRFRSGLLPYLGRTVITVISSCCTSVHTYK